MAEDFYKLTSPDGEEITDPRDHVPPFVSDQPLDTAKERSTHYDKDKIIYIVRGKNLFSVDSADIKVTMKGDLRDIFIRNAKMVKL